jgi:hypothetical protein
MATIAMVSNEAEAQDHEPETLEADGAGEADDRGCWVPSPGEIAEGAEAVRKGWSLVEHFRRWVGDPGRLVDALVAEGHPRQSVEAALASREKAGPAIGGGRYAARGK